MAHKIYIVEDHPIVRLGYMALIEAEVDLEICGTTESATEALHRIPDANPDLVIVDLSVAEGSGLELIKDLQATHPDLPTLVVSMHDEAIYADRSFRAGAKGYLMKCEMENQVIRAIRRILNGGIYMSAKVQETILLKYVGAETPSDVSVHKLLSDRELQVFECLGRGMTTSEIAEHLMLSPKTIASYRARLKEKLAAESNAQLRRHATLWVEGDFNPTSHSP